MPSALTRETLHRGAKILVDLGLAESWAGAYRLLLRYKIGILVGSDTAASRSGQICLLSIVNTAVRSCPGGVFVYGLNDDQPSNTNLATATSLKQAVEEVGGTLSNRIEDVPLICLGTVVPPDLDSPVLRATYGGWSAGVVPYGTGTRLGEDDVFAPAAILAASVAVSECFTFLLGQDFMAAKRCAGVSLLDPSSDWREETSSPPLLPSSAWLLGLGHLGQAYAWTLAALPYPRDSRPLVVLQDFDVTQEANLSTSVLSNKVDIGRLKTRVVAKWLEDRNFKTRLVERPFRGEVKLEPSDPSLLFCGVDNLKARRLLEEPGFKLVIDVGLGAAATDYAGFILQTFTDGARAQKAYPEPPKRSKKSPVSRNEAAYRSLGLDECGMHLAADAAVGVPFVGLAAAALAIAEASRALAGAPLFDIVAGSLDSIAGTDWIQSGRYAPNTGFIPVQP